MEQAIRTIRKWKTTKRLLSEFLGADCDVASITAGDASRFKLHLMKMTKSDGTKFYSPSTLGKHIEGAKLFFTAAVDDGIRSDNPFAKVKGSMAVNEDRVHFISQEDIRKCIEATPDKQWKLIIALSRFGGLRTPSEHLRLRWDDILWDQNKIVVHSRNAGFARSPEDFRSQRMLRAQLGLCKRGRRILRLISSTNSAEIAEESAPQWKSRRTTLTMRLPDTRHQGVRRELCQSVSRPVRGQDQWDTILL